MKRKDSILLEQAYLKVLKEDSEMDFLAQQDPREADISQDEAFTSYENVVNDTVKDIVNQIQSVTMQVENEYPDDSGRFFTDIITRLVDRLKPLSR
jgi:hypothetical protein